MGIKGLHKALSFCTVKDNLRNYRNSIVAVDTSSWMHKSVYSISEKFVEATQSRIVNLNANATATANATANANISANISADPCNNSNNNNNNNSNNNNNYNSNSNYNYDSNDYNDCVRVSARYITARCKELIDAFGIKAVYLVMDGKRIPLKAEETKDRDQKRNQNLQEARRFKRMGNNSSNNNNNNTNSNNKWKAEDKYKSCIRIGDDFTRAVINEVEKAFCNNHNNSNNRYCVFFVNSPYEADSQLTRLVLDGVADAVITEDSDVLVYSAAAHKPFPILFKLDRKTGACDTINMDWLIEPNKPREAEKAEAKGANTTTITITNAVHSRVHSRVQIQPHAHAQHHAQPRNKKQNTLEFILRRFANKQASTKGLGVRLFVQGCILSGCDYRKNIEGIGTTNAFKLVSEHAFRDPSVRFLKILESLPRAKRQKHNIDVHEYEQILSKSEAIFFYHPVLHTDGRIKPLLVPRMGTTMGTTENVASNSDENHHVHTHDTTTASHTHTDYYPFMARFQGDWSFLGSASIDSNGNTNDNNNDNNNDNGANNNSNNININNNSIEHQESKSMVPSTTTTSTTLKKRDHSRSSAPTRPQILHNPYKKYKSYNNNNNNNNEGSGPGPKSLPLEEKNANIQTQTVHALTRHQERKSGKARGVALRRKAVGAITKFLVKPDPRYARRTAAFSSTTTTTNNKGSRALKFWGAGSSFRLSSSRSTPTPTPTLLVPSKKTKSTRQFFFEKTTTKKPMGTRSTIHSSNNNNDSDSDNPRAEQRGFDNDNNCENSSIENIAESEASFSYPSFRDESSSSSDESKGKRTKRARSGASRSTNTSTRAVHDGFQNVDKHLDEQDFFDLTNSNSTTNDERKSAGIEEARGQARAPSNTDVCREDTKAKDFTTFEYNNTDDDDDHDHDDDDDSSFPPEDELDDNEEQKHLELELEQASSKYFSDKMSTRNPRRVTLDSCTSPSSCLGISSAGCQKSKSAVARSADAPVPVDDAIASSPEARYNFLYRENEWDSDECIDDPEEEPEVVPVKPRPASQIDNSFAERINSSLLQAPQENPQTSRRSESNSKFKGSSIGSYFKQQQKFATEVKRSTQFQPKTRTQQLPAVPVPVPRSKPKPKPNDFFSPERYSKSKKMDSTTSSSRRLAGKMPSACTLFNKKNLTSQLNLKRGQSQSSEAYLWNGTP